MGMTGHEGDLPGKGSNWQKQAMPDLTDLNYAKNERMKNIVIEIPNYRDFIGKIWHN